MAIQLNDRDQLIFKLVDEHQVLLEKHISYFISTDSKPVLIRDRLRKLFYLDYLLCHRHGTKLPWWTTPTKPLVYMLSPMARTVSGCAESQLDLFDANVQRHLLEVANLRMLLLVAQQDGQINKLDWTTIKADASGCKRLDAKVTFNNNGSIHTIGIINHPDVIEKLTADLEAIFAANTCEKVLIVSRDDAHQLALQKALKELGAAWTKRCFFATHHELYKEGIINTHWQSADAQEVRVFITANETIKAPWTAAVNFTPAPAI